eukprot:365081_1
MVQKQKRKYYQFNIYDYETNYKYYHSNDYNIIMEEDEYKEHIDDEEDVVVLQLGDINNQERNNSNPFSHVRVTYHLWFYIFITILIPNNDNDNNNNNNSQERALHLISSESLSNPLDDISSVGSIHQPNTATNSHDGIIVYEGTFTW